MPSPENVDLPPEQERLNEILTKIMVYQHTLADGRAVELEELSREGVLSTADLEFLTAHSITYKSHRLSDFHSMDMFHMPVKGGCIFTGPSGPPLRKRAASLGAFRPIVESFLKLPRPKDELILHIEFSDDDGIGISPNFVSFCLRSAEWRNRLPRIREAARELGWHFWQDEEIPGSYSLSFDVGGDAVKMASDVTALLERGCGFKRDDHITYSAGALDEG